MVDFNKMVGIDSWDFSGDDNAKENPNVSENSNHAVEPEFEIPISQKSVAVADDSSEEEVSHTPIVPVSEKPAQVRESYSIKEFQSRGIYRDMVSMEIMSDSVDTIVGAKNDIKDLMHIYRSTAKDFGTLMLALPSEMERYSVEICGHLRSTLQEELDSKKDGSIAARIDQYTGHVVVRGTTHLNGVISRGEGMLNGLIGSLGEDIIILKGVVVNVSKQSKRIEVANDELRMLNAELIKKNKEFIRQNKELVQKVNELLIALQPKKKWWQK